MTTYTRREVSVTKVEYLIPARWPEGADWVEVQKAIYSITQEMKEAGRLDSSVPSDDAIRVVPGDDELIVYYEFKTAAADAGGGE